MAPWQDWEKSYGPGGDVSRPIGQPSRERWPVSRRGWQERGEAYPASWWSCPLYREPSGGRLHSHRDGTDDERETERDDKPRSG